MKLYVVYKWLVLDVLRTWARRIWPALLLVTYYLLSLLQHRSRYRYLLAAIRASNGQLGLQQLARSQANVLDYCSKYSPSDEDNWLHRLLVRSIVIKNPIIRDSKVVQKGVLVVTFTNTFNSYRKHIQCQYLTKVFTVVLEPSWAGYALEDILAWDSYQEPVIVGASESRDREMLQLLNCNLKETEVGASDWVDEQKFFPKVNLHKKYDAIMVANYNSIKRHHVLFRAIKNLKDQSFRVAIASNGWGGNKEQLLKLAELYDIKDRVTVFESLSHTELNELLGDAKVNVLLSLKEGSNRGIFEGFFSNTPAIVLENNIGVNKKYINDATGMLIKESDLPASLIHCKLNWNNYSPAKWARLNISAVKSTEAIKRKFDIENNVLSDIEHFAVKVNSPEVMYQNVMDANRMLSSKFIYDIFSIEHNNDLEHILSEIYTQITTLNQSFEDTIAL